VAVAGSSPGGQAGPRPQEGTRSCFERGGEAKTSERRGPPNGGPGGAASLVKQAKDEAFQQVKAQLKPLYERKAISREEYKRVAQAATHSLYNEHLRQRPAAAEGPPQYSDAAVLQAIEEARGSKA